MAAETLYGFRLYWLLLALFAATCLLLHHSAKVYLHHGLNKATLPTDLLSLFLITLAIVGLSVFIATIFIPPDNAFCIFAAHYKASGYSAFKTTLFCILIIRCGTAFKASSVEYARWKLELWAFVLLVWSMANMVGINVTASNVDGSSKCGQWRPPLPILASLGLLDIVSCVVNTALFTRPLFKLHRNMMSNQCAPSIRGSNLEERSLKKLAVKQCVLSLIAVLSTMTSLVTLAVFRAYYISIGFDYLMSSLCVLLMYSWNAPLVETMCCCLPNRCCSAETDAAPRMAARSVPSESTTKRSVKRLGVPQQTVPPLLTPTPSVPSSCSVSCNVSGEESEGPDPKHSSDPSILKEIKVFFEDAEQVEIDHIASVIIPVAVSPDDVTSIVGGK